jgi:hypothetical protein
MSDRAPLPHDFHPEVPSFTVTSTDITHGGVLPTAHEAGASMGRAGGDLSPALTWSGFPAETKSFAVTCYDPDAPTGSGFWHWVVFDIPANVTSLPTGAGSGDQSGLPSGAITARNDAGTLSYVGAAPPPGDRAHRYVFTIYAVDTESLGLDASATPAFVGFNLRFHTLARANLIAEFAYEG